MKEIKNIIDAFQKVDFSQNQVALATVVRVEGSSYRRTGARMLVIDNGEWIGGISGGCLEGDALKKARLAIANNKAAMITYDTSDDDPYQIGVGLGCNGIIDIILSPIDAKDDQNPILMLEPCLDARTISIAITVIGSKGETGLVLGEAFRFDEHGFNRNCIIESLILPKIQEVLASEKSVSETIGLENGASVTLFFEVIPPAMHLLVHGGNYDIYSMVKIAKEIGWKVSVFCNPQKVHASLFNLADQVLAKDTIVQIDRQTAVILMAHDYETDFGNMRKYLKTSISYIGMLGPKKRTDKMFLKLKEEGNPISENDLSRIYSPVGLDIGANTPEEIAVSVIAEIKSTFSGRSGNRLKFREKPIYEE